jgi:hypothetical protein
MSSLRSCRYIFIIACYFTQISLYEARINPKLLVASNMFGHATLLATILETVYFRREWYYCHHLGSFQYQKVKVRRCVIPNYRQFFMGPSDIHRSCRPSLRKSSTCITPVEMTFVTRSKSYQPNLALYQLPSVWRGIQTESI